MAVCYACLHPARELIDEYYRRGRVIINGENVGTAKYLSEVLARDYPDARNPSEASLLNHNKNKHVKSSNIIAVIHADGQIQLADGVMVPRVGVIEYLDNTIALANFNNLKTPERVSAAQGNEAAALKVRIQKGALDEDEIKDAWARVLGQEKKRKVKKVRVEEESEETEPLEADYEVIE